MGSGISFGGSSKHSDTGDRSVGQNAGQGAAVNNVSLGKKSSVGGDLSITTTDFGAIDAGLTFAENANADALDFASNASSDAFSFAKNANADALDSVNNAVFDSYKYSENVTNTAFDTIDNISADHLAFSKSVSQEAFGLGDAALMSVDNAMTNVANISSDAIANSKESLWAALGFGRDALDANRKAVTDSLDFGNNLASDAFSSNNKAIDVIGCAFDSFGSYVTDLFNTQKEANTKAQDTVLSAANYAITGATQDGAERQTKTLIYAVGAMGVALVIAWGLKK